MLSSEMRWANMSSGPFVLILGLGVNVIGPGKAFNAQKLCSFKRKSCILLKK